MKPDPLLAAAITKGKCPSCFSRGFVLGPRGGAAQNIECANIDCRARFNVTMWRGECVLAEPIERIAAWPSEPEVNGKGGT